MSTLDIIIIAILGIAAFSGFRTGFVMEIVSIAALVLGIIGGFVLLHEGIDFLQFQFDLTGELIPYLAFLLIFLSIIILVNLLGRVTKKALDLTLLGSIDNVAGALVSVFKWSFGLSVLIWIFEYFDLNPLQRFTAESSLYPIIADVAPSIMDLISVLLPFTEDLFSLVEQVA